MAKLSLLVVSGLLVGACSSDASTHLDAPDGVKLAKSALARATAPSDSNVSALGAGNRAFAFDLFHQVAAGSEGQNMLVSPYSVSTALAMTYAGARGNTAAEMQSALHFDLAQPQLHEAFNAVDTALASRGAGAAGADGTPFRLNVDNSLWAQRDYPVEPAFLDTLAVNYGAGVFLANFAGAPEPARAAINGWVSEQTEKLIPELLPKGSIHPLTRFVLTDTVYFNASWEKQFDVALTQGQAFTKLDGTQLSAPMMRAALSVPFAKGVDYQAIALPYAGNALRFIAVLPNEGAFESLETELTAKWFDALTEDWTTDNVAITLPKLDYKAHASLKPALKELGMRDAFEGGADFSGMTSRDVFIDDVIHEAVVKVFEGGTIAAAATAVTFRTKGALMMSQSVTFDRPFFFAIVDEPTGEILFLGRVLDPTAK